MKSENETIIRLRYKCIDFLEQMVKYNFLNEEKNDLEEILKSVKCFYVLIILTSAFLNIFLSALSFIFKYPLSFYIPLKLFNIVFIISLVIFSMIEIKRIRKEYVGTSVSLKNISDVCNYMMILALGPENYFYYRLYRKIKEVF